jgi:site-specific DNA-methyltransferase (adenine-specific)
MTPAWAAERLLETKFRLSADDIACDPTCGDGSFLGAVPQHIHTFGVEIDPAMAERARRNTGRQVIVGDIRTVQVPETPTVIIGNPPFVTEIMEAIMRRALEWLPEGGRMGLILGAYMLANCRRTLCYRERWSITAELLPRNLFGRMETPIVFAMFQKGGRRLVGFTLFEELFDVNGMRPADREDLKQAGRTWRAVVERAFRQLGGKAHLQDLYAAVKPLRPTDNPWWQAKVRQVVAQNHHRIERGVYALEAA